MLEGLLLFAELTLQSFFLRPHYSLSAKTTTPPLHLNIGPLMIIPSADQSLPVILPHCAPD